MSDRAYYGRVVAILVIILAFAGLIGDYEIFGLVGVFGLIGLVGFLYYWFGIRGRESTDRLPMAMRAGSPRNRTDFSSG